MLEDESPWLALQIADEPEVMTIQKEINENLQEVENLARANLDMKNEMIGIVANYEEKRDIYVLNK